MPFLLNLASAAPRLTAAFFSDVLNLPTRALVPLSLVLDWPTLRAFTSGNLFYGLLGTVSTGLTALSLGVLFKENSLALAKLAALGYGADAVAQLVKMLAPDVLTYPASRTGFPALALQLPLSMLALAPDVAKGLAEHIPRCLLLSAAVSARFLSFHFEEVSGLFQVAGFVLAIFGTTPQGVWKLLYDILRRIGAVMAVMGSAVYAAATYILPRLIAMVRAVLQHPWTVHLYRYVVLPLWNFLSPLFLPAWTSAIGISCLNSLLQPGGRADTIVRLAQGYNACAAMLSTAILVTNLVLNCRRRSQPDPLQNAALLSCLMYPAAAVAIPVRGLRRALLLFCDCVLGPAFHCFWKCIASLGTFAMKKPVLSIPAVIVANIQLVRFLSGNSMPALSSLGVGLHVVSTAWEALGEMRSGATTDRAFALLLITCVQVGAYAMVDGVLAVLRVVRQPQTDHALNIDELNDLAAAMADPRQCGRCGLGPVDYRGCENLSTHHGERTRGGQILNQCLRCGWFARSLRQWPTWDGELQTEQGRALYRQRTWCEVVVTIKASSKALVVPYSMLLLGQWLRLPSTFAAGLALSYLLPWTLENLQLFESLASPVAPPRARHGRAPHVQSPGGGDDCGARPQEPEAPDITQSEALQCIQASVPEAIFLQPGSLCSVCLDTFPDAAVDLVAGDVAGACQALQQLDPPIVALRCGHPLHLECAMAAVSASRSRHLRCPLCRQPVTWAGEATANIFS